MSDSDTSTSTEEIPSGESFHIVYASSDDSLDEVNDEHNDYIGQENTSLVLQRSNISM